MSCKGLGGSQSMKPTATPEEDQALQEGADNALFTD